MNTEAEVEKVIEKIMKTSYGKLLSALCSRFRDLEACEDALASAFSHALEAWKSGLVPMTPEGWIFQAAKNNLIDQKRKESRKFENKATLVQLEEEKSSQEELDYKDHRLKLMFVCSHPSIDESVRTPLMLQTVLGLDSSVIASAFLTSPAAMMKKLVRAKQKIKLAGIAFEVPDINSLSERTEFVTEAIFAAFGKSWDSLGSIDSKLSDLNEEALYLSKLLVELLPDEPEAKGLLAFILFCESRKSARRSHLGEYIPLDEQDVNIWNQTYISEAEKLLQDAFSKVQLGRFQLEAAIQSAHCARVKFRINNWPAILKLYDGLLSMAHTTGALIGRVNALSEVQGPESGLEELENLPLEITQIYQPYWAVKASLLSKLGKRSEAITAFEIAIGLSQDEAVKNYLKDKIISERKLL